MMPEGQFFKLFCFPTIIKSNCLNYYAKVIEFWISLKDRKHNIWPNTFRMHQLMKTYFNIPISWEKQNSWPPKFGIHQLNQIQQITQKLETHNSWLETYNSWIHKLWNALVMLKQNKIPKNWKMSAVSTFYFNSNLLCQSTKLIFS